MRTQADVGASQVVFGIDVGGSGIKGAPVDLTAGAMLGERHRIITPQPATPDAVLDIARDVVVHFGWQGPVGLALPAVVQHGVVRTAANIDKSWIDVDAAAMFSARVGSGVRLLNDADAAGLAEMRFGAGRGAAGMVLMLTFGTGIGSAIFFDGQLLPNTELGHVEFRGGDAERYAAARLVEDEGMDLGVWARRVDEYLDHLERVLFPDLIVFGGGISKRFDEFAPLLTTRAELAPAELRNNAGIVGAALAASQPSPSPEP